MLAGNNRKSQKKRISRRILFEVWGGASLVGVTGCDQGSDLPSSSSRSSVRDSISFGRVVDLSHTLHPDFPACYLLQVRK